MQGRLRLRPEAAYCLGTWGSNINWLEDFGLCKPSSLEWDFYGGFKVTNFPNSDFFYDLGTIYYYPRLEEPGRRERRRGSYAALGWKWVSVKFSYNLDDYFGLRRPAR